MGENLKRIRSWEEQVALLVERGLEVRDDSACADFLKVNNYYRFSGYARYFQVAPHEGDNRFLSGSTFESIREIYEADEELRAELARPLARAEVVLRTHAA